MKILKKYKYAILAFIIPIVIFCTFFLLKETLTKGLFSRSDSLEQYWPTYQYLYNVLHGNATFPYTLSKGLGGSMYGAFFYGISSPINIFIYFFKDIQLFMFLSTMIKIGLAGLTMFILLKYKNKNIKHSLIFSFSYTLSGYIILYGCHIMWLDSLWLAPLVLLGINKFIYHKKQLLYILTLLISLISNYYTGYMITIFSIVYFFYELYISYDGHNFFKENRKKIIQFLITTILIGGAILFILIPIFIESLYFNRVDIEKNIFNINFLDLFAGTYMGFGNFYNPLNYYGMLAYCGTITLPLIINYFTCSFISKKEKKASFIIFLILLLPIFIKPLSYIWHLFTYPQGFNYRYSFLLVIFIILLSSKSFLRLEVSKKSLKIFFILYLIISVSLGYTTYSTPEYFIYLTIPKIIITIIFLLINIALIVKNKKKYLLMLLILELIINLIIIFDTFEVLLIKNYDNYSSLIKRDINDKNDNNYRFESSEYFSRNDPLLFNYNGVSSFLSSNNINNIKSNYLLNGIVFDSQNYYTYSKHNIISDTILGIKYIYDIELNSHYKLIDTYDIGDKKIYFQKNDYALPIGYMVSTDIKEMNHNKLNNIEQVNNLLNSINGKKDNYFVKLKVNKKNSTKYIVERQEDFKQLFVFLKINDKNNMANINVYDVYNDNKTSELVLDTENEDIAISSVYALDINKFKKLVEERDKFDINEIDNNVITGDIEVSKDGVFILTVPYEKGWEIFIDGAKVEYYEALDYFVGFDLSKGEHEIKLYYKVPGFSFGVCCSGISLILLIVYTLRNKSQRVLGV